MKAVPLLLFIFISTALISQTEASSSGLGATGTGFVIRNIASTDLGARNIENKMTDSLHNLNLAKPEEKNKVKANATRADLPQIMPLMNGTLLNNSSLNNISLDNSSFIDLSAVNASAQNSSRGMGSSSNGKYSGFYGIEASRHEMGKSDISSKMLLSGGFEVDKTVKFQDRDY
jgi:hypothetical protein